jgi:hypothetical protein
MATAGPAPNDLTTLQNALVWLGCPNDDAYGTLQRVITAVSTAIQSWAARPLKAADHVEVFDGRGRSRIMMSDYPINSVSSVIIGELMEVSVPPRVVVPGSQAPGYTFSDKFVYVDPPYFFDKGRRNVQISYNAGFTTIPFDLEQGCLIWIKAIMDGANYSAALKSAKAGTTALDFSHIQTKLTSSLTVTMPPGVHNMLVSYQKVTPTW